MSNLIDDSYFKGDINVPVSSNTTLAGPLNQAITDYEEEYLKRLLGYTLYAEFIAGLAADSPAQKWLDLRNGVEFSFDFNGNTITNKWNGFVNSDKISPIAYYVYYKHRVDIESINSGLGERKAKGENSVIHSANLKLVRAWNKCVNLSGEQSISYKRYPYYFLNTTNYFHTTPLPSAFNFLLDNLTDYSNWVFTPFWKINSFGL